MILSIGILGVLFLIVWQIRAENKPRYSNYITATELEYIQGKRRRQRANTIVRPTPYKTVNLSVEILLQDGVNDSGDFNKI